VRFASELKTLTETQVWDLRSTEHVRDYTWTSHNESCMLYAAQYSKDANAKHIVAGGSGSNEVKPSSWLPTSSLFPHAECNLYPASGPAFSHAQF
jgi:hypothetical protein